ncbi:MAG: hypothetical protein ABSH34_35615 [Verrucomicrobiota bacterium]
MSALCQVEDAGASLLRAVPLARELEQRIASERRLTATIGVASNKLLAISSQSGKEVRCRAIPPWPGLTRVGSKSAGKIPFP